jgi:hypothetical protein
VALRGVKKGASAQPGAALDEAHIEVHIVPLRVMKELSSESLIKKAYV